MTLGEKHLQVRTLIVLIALLSAALSACSISQDRADIFSNVSGESRLAESPSTLPLTAAAPGASEAALVNSAAAESEMPPSPQLTAVNAVPSEPDITDGINDPRSERLRTYLENLSTSNQFMGAVLIAEGDRLILSEGYGMANIAESRANTPQTQLRIGSLTKQFTAALILRLQEQQLLNVADPVSTYLPDYPGGDNITIHQLLTHSAGVANYTERRDLAQVVQSPIALEDLVAEISSRPLDFAPGQQYAYSDSGYVILTKIIEVVSGQTYDSYLESQILNPAGMSRSGYDFLAPALVEPAEGYQLTPGGPQQTFDTDSSWPSGAGALYSTVEDMYRWDRALTGATILNAASLAAMFEPWVSAGQGFSYGYGWEVGEMAGRPSQTHAGTIFGFGSFIARFPEDDATVILLSNGLQMSPRRIAEELARILFLNNSQ